MHERFLWLGSRSLNSDKVNKWLTILANTGVVVGLVLLIIEIRQNTEMMRAQINQSRTEAAQSEQQAMFNSDYMPAILAKHRKGEKLSDEEILRVRAYMRGFNRNMNNQLWQYNQGLPGENIPRSVRGAARSVIGGSKLTIEIWEEQKYGFTDEYVEFVEGAIEDLRQQYQGPD
jgi:hypothetical protein